MNRVEELRRRWLLSSVTCLVAACGSAAWILAVERPETITQASASPTPSGTVVFEFDPQAIRELGWEVAPRGTDFGSSDNDRLRARVGASSLLKRGENGELNEARIEASGALAVSIAGRREVVGNFSIRGTDDGAWQVFSTLGDEGDGAAVFDLSAVTLDAPRGTGGLRLAGELTVASEWASRVGAESAVGAVVGRVLIFADGLTATPIESLSPDAVATSDGGAAMVIGPDVIVGNLHETLSYGSSGGISAFAVGTTSCNQGDVWLNWFSNSNQHPVIGQNMFRLKNGRFEQIGQGWLKHGFFALSGTLCSGACQATNGEHLGVNCSDPYSASLNGQQFNLGPKYDVNAHTGAFGYPPPSPPWSGTIARRLQVKNTDLDPALDGGGIYFVEGQYVTPDDAASGNQNNNASYRRVSVSGSGGGWGISLASTTQREQAGIRAWKDNDPAVLETDVQVAGEGLFILAAKSTNLGNGYWHYDYAVQNLTSHRSARAFSVPVDPAGKIINIGFHDVPYHSGEPFNSTDWTPVVSNGSITWSTVGFDANPNANALRWGTLYNFRFDANRAPQSTDITLTLYRSGTPDSVTAATVGPVTNGEDCNGNLVPDSLDIQNGTSQDCDGDLIPDECETFELAATRVATGLDRPVYVTAAPGDDTRLFIVEQDGRIKILSGGAVPATPFLDLTDRVGAINAEQGLFSVAFHPSYAANGRFFVDYTNLNGDTVIARYTVTANPDVASPASEVILKTIAQDDISHNGGQLQFGADGFLYVGMGDGGGGFDPGSRGQDPNSLLGKMLRLNVDSPPNYIPSSNPFVGFGPPLDEIWAFGLRNPWRFSFDRVTGDMYIADVGQSSWEEIDFEPAGGTGGKNYGWRCMEGAHCTGLSGCTCNDSSLSLPIVEYANVGVDCAITGGYVYRGCALPNFLGTYFYADYCANTIRSFRYSGGQVNNHVDRTAELTPPTGGITSIVSFGEDADGELYIVSHDGSIYKIVPAAGGAPVCGNNVVEQGEQCDDGNTTPGDGCSAICVVESGPGNDLCANAFAVQEGVVAFNTTRASTDGPNESAVCVNGNPPVGSDVWYCYNPTCTGTATISLCGSQYDTMLAIYGDCTCPPLSSALACNDDFCGTDSQISIPVAACEPLLIRVGGFDAAQGAGTMSVTCVPNPVVIDCDENGVEDAADIACGTHVDNDHNGVPDICQVNGDTIVGGRLYDRWWSVVGASAPATTHPLWAYRPDQTSNASTGSSTWRCTECHGWDYKGVAGEYASGPHRTGFPGVLGGTLPVPAVFSLLKDPPSNGGGPGVLNGHDFGSVLADARLDDLIAFVLSGAVDTDLYLNPVSGQFIGNPAVGQMIYTTAGTLSQCISCHGADGTAINFGTQWSPEYLGTVAVNEPTHFLHRARMGIPGTPMLGFLANGGSNQGTADIGRYAQLNFPVDCLVDAHCDDGVACTLDVCDAGGRCVHTADDAVCLDNGQFCDGVERCDLIRSCVGSGDPCLMFDVCDEVLDSCGCSTPLVTAAGGRYLAISVQPVDGVSPMRLLVTADCSGGVSKYVGAPQGLYHVAFLVDDPNDAAILMPAQWGATVYLTDIEIIPATSYSVRADCTNPLRPIPTAPAVVQTPLFGDVVGWNGTGQYLPPDNVVNAIDIVSIIDRFRGMPLAPSLYATDLYSCMPDQKVNALDVTAGLDAFRGRAYPAGACGGPCPAQRPVLGTEKAQAASSQ